jgi:hypothetical protein
MEVIHIQTMFSQPNIAKYIVAKHYNKCLCNGVLENEEQQISTHMTAQVMVTTMCKKSGVQGIWVIPFFKEFLGKNKLTVDMAMCVASPSGEQFYASKHMTSTSPASVL